MTAPFDVVVFGEAIWDFFPRRAGEPLRTRRHEVRHPGGAPANVARTLAGLGLRTSLVTALGDDELGRAMVEELAARGVGTNDIVLVPARTAVTFVEVREDGSRSFLFYRHPSADMTLERSQLRPAAFLARWVHLGSSTLSRSPTREATLEAVRLGAEQGALVSVDINARRHLWPKDHDLRIDLAPVLERADFLKASEEDLEALGVPPTIEGARALHALRTGRLTVLTLAERGAIGFLGQHELHLPAPEVPVRDVTGAGDAFVAGALAVLARHPDAIRTTSAHEALLRRVLGVGCALGSRAVTRLGATTALKRVDSVTKLVMRPLQQ
jgi:fructokinase